MTFKEMKKLHDPFKCHHDYFTVDEAKQLGYIPENFHDLFDDHCKCGSENIITYNLSRMTCCDPKCKIRQGYMLAALLKRFGCKGLADEKCKKIVDYLIDRTKRNTYIEMLFYELKDLPPGLSDYAIGRDFIDATYLVLREELTFPSMVAKLGIPALDSEGCRKLFEDIQDFKGFVAKLDEEGDVQQYCLNRGIRDEQIIFWLYNSLFEIGLAEVYFSNKMRLKGLREIVVTMTGRLSLEGSNISKDDLIIYCNKISRTKDGVPLFEVSRNDSVSTNRFVVADRSTVIPRSGSDKKFRKGLERQLRIENLRGLGYDVEDVLITPEKLVKIIKEGVEEWEKANQELLN